MSKSQTLRGLMEQRLSLAAEEIFELFERTIAEYEEQLCRSKEENERQQKLLEAVYKPEVRLHKADVQKLLSSEEEVHPHQQEWSPSLDQDQENSEPLHIKEEEEGEQLHGLEEAEISVLFLPVKSDEEDGEKLWQRDDACTDESREDTRKSQVNVEALQNATGAKRLKPRRKTLRPFSCVICTKTFRWRGDMISHMRAHTGEKPFQCSICGSKFTRNHSLHLHFRIHTGEKPFSCSVCQTSFSRKNTLDVHMRSHTGDKPFVCSLCGKSFPTQRNLTRHSLVHSKEKLFSCSVCGKGFAQRTTLKRHWIIHSGEKPFSCEICRKKFSQSHHLSNHKCVVG